MKSPFLFPLLIWGLGCAPALSDAAKRIKVAQKQEVANCKFLSVVYGGHNKGEVWSRNIAIEKAATLRATHVVVLFDQDGKFTADALDCNQQRVASKPKKKAKPPQPPSQPTTPVAPVPTKPGVKPSKEWVVAVMNVEYASKKDGKISTNLMRNIGDQLRVFVAQKGVRTIDRGAQDSMLKNQIEAAKGDSYKACYDDECQVELGKALAASHILRTRITRFGRLCVLNGELIDLRTEVAIAAASSRGDCEAEGFLTMSDEVASTLIAQ